MVGIDWNLVFQMINTIVLYFLLRRFLFKPVTEYMKNRREDIKNDIDEAEKNNKEAKELKAKYEEKLASVKEEGEQIIKEARQKAADQKEKILNDAEKEADRLMERANKEIERSKTKALDEYKKEAVDMTLLAASKFVDKELDKDNHEKLISEFIEEMRDEKWQS
ncbi:MAG: F0F1 ATP synthase subunit B [Firmicutes bacterium]|nr:F0F1 ATP synthase subunit B [Bacillota bacterium]